jgi:Flp pilus assembly pilin Flp
MDLLTTLYADDRGFIVSVELILIVTIVVIGMIAGLTVLRDAIISELEDVSQAVMAIDQQQSVNRPLEPIPETIGKAPGGTRSLVGQNDYDDPVADNCVQVFGTGNF